jgi:hypothetical protein
MQVSLPQTQMYADSSKDQIEALRIPSICDNLRNLWQNCIRASILIAFTVSSSEMDCCEISHDCWSENQGSWMDRFVVALQPGYPHNSRQPMNRSCWSSARSRGA